MNVLANRQNYVLTKDLGQVTWPLRAKKKNGKRIIIPTAKLKGRIDTPMVVRLPTRCQARSKGQEKGTYIRAGRD